MRGYVIFQAKCAMVLGLTIIYTAVICTGVTFESVMLCVWLTLLVLCGFGWDLLKQKTK